jgi:hypothetical protein
LISTESPAATSGSPIFVFKKKKKNSGGVIPSLSLSTGQDGLESDAGG